MAHHPELQCKHCSSIILKPDTGERLVTHIDSLPMGAELMDKTQYTDWVNVKDHFDFWNVGFKRTVASNEKYLVCADCERGPIGLQYVDSGKIYVAMQLVKHVE